MGNASRDCMAGGVWGGLTTPTSCVSPVMRDLLRRVINNRLYVQLDILPLTFTSHGSVIEAMLQSLCVH